MTAEKALSLFYTPFLLNPTPELREKQHVRYVGARGAYARSTRLSEKGLKEVPLHTN
jgi:hypothetical protein